MLLKDDKVDRACRSDIFWYALSHYAQSPWQFFVMCWSTATKTAIGSLQVAGTSISSSIAAERPLPVFQPRQAAHLQSAFQVRIVLQVPLVSQEDLPDLLLSESRVQSLRICSNSEKNFLSLDKRKSNKVKLTSKQI